MKKFIAAILIFVAALLAPATAQTTDSTEEVQYFVTDTIKPSVGDSIRFQDWASRVRHGSTWGWYVIKANDTIVPLIEGEMLNENWKSRCYRGTWEIYSPILPTHSGVVMDVIKADQTATNTIAIGASTSNSGNPRFVGGISISSGKGDSLFFSHQTDPFGRIRGEKWLLGSSLLRVDGISICSGMGGSTILGNFRFVSAKAERETNFSSVSLSAEANYGNRGWLGLMSRLELAVKNCNLKAGVFLEGKSYNTAGWKQFAMGGLFLRKKSLNLSYFGRMTIQLDRKFYQNTELQVGIQFRLARGR